MIDYQLLQALYAVVTEKGFERAAQTLFITQSAVSKRINQLESILGEPVLVRTKPPKATELGIKLLTHLQQVKQLELSLNLQSSSEFVDKQLPVTVKIATNADSLATWLPEALSVPEEYSDFKYRFEIITEDQTIALNRMKAHRDRSTPEGHHAERHRDAAGERPGQKDQSEQDQGANIDPGRQTAGQRQEAR